MTKIKIAVFSFFLFFLSSCIKPERPSSEADIISFSLPDIHVLDTTISPNSVYVLVEDKYWSRLSNIAPQMVVSPGATILPPSGTLVDLTNTEFTVIAEDKVTRKKYTIKMGQEYLGDTVHFSFEDWMVTSDGYYASKDINWSSGNPGVSLGLGLLGEEKIPENYPSQMTPHGVKGDAVMLKTREGGQIAFVFIPVWAGNFFLGNFNTAKALSSTLGSTEFGRVYKRKPKKMQGYYKYKEGPGLYNDNGNKINRSDSCAIYAVYYEANDGGTLTALDVSNSPRVVARAQILDGSSTVGDGYHFFDLDFVYTREPDLTKQHKLAVVFSSSAVGAALRDGQTIYAGKPGSVLMVDEVKIINFEENGQ